MRCVTEGRASRIDYGKARSEATPGTFAFVVMPAAGLSSRGRFSRGRRSEVSGNS
jgi:hypothetical protein